MTESPSNIGSRSQDVDLSGRLFGDFQLLRRLGRGAMAEVYLAEQMSLRRNVAFKVLKSELATDEKYIQRFHMEARAAAGLIHANIVQIYEVGHEEGTYYIAQEYVQGQNLAELLNRVGSPDLVVTVGIMRQVAAALSKAGQQGVIHRDIKPENLMLASTGEVKVADFGLARVIQSEEQMKLTQVGVTMGSPLYMSPEQVEGKSLDPRSDIYSFGITCYQMLAGRTPFNGDTVLSIAVQHLRSTPERLENLRPDLPAGICRIVHRMLSKAPQDRHANGAEVLQELRGLDIAELDGDWPEELEQFNSTESIALFQARNAATQQLSVVMSNEPPSSKPITRQWVFWIVVLLGLILGVALGLPQREPSLLEGVSEIRTGILRQKNGNDQYWYAQGLSAEVGWLSVLEYFPEDRYHSELAKKKLADIYYRDNRLYEAMKYYDAFTRSEDEALRAYGFAGQYLIRMQDQELESAAKAFRQFWPHRHLLDESDAGMLHRVYEIYKDQGQDEGGHRFEIDQWLMQHDHEFGQDEFDHRGGDPGGGMNPVDGRPFPPDDRQGG